MDGPTLEAKAAAYLEAAEVWNVLPEYRSWASIMQAGRMKLHVMAYNRQLALVAGGMSIHSLEHLGHIVSKTAWRLQEGDQDTDILNQNHPYYVHHRFPLPTEAVHFIGVARRTASLVHQLSFKICIHVDGRELIIGEGSSSLTVVPGRAVMIEVDPNEKVLQPSRPTRPESGPEPAHPGPPSPVLSIIAPSDAQDPSPWPMSPMSSPSRAEPFPESMDVHGNKEFMMVNFKTSNPSHHEEFIKKMDEIGVKVENIRSEKLPIKLCDRHVYYFELSVEDVAKIEGLVDSRNWPKLFNVSRLQQGEPFFWRALTIAEIIEAVIFSTMIAQNGDSESEGYDSDLAQLLADKKNIGGVLKNDGLVKEVLAGLNRSGYGIYKKDVKPFASK